VHHSQEELSILTTFRAHPLVHVSFLFSAIPVLAVESNVATPAAVFTAYACLGALPHANVRWSYGPAGRIFASPAYHRIHHSATGRLDINLAPSCRSGMRSRAARSFPSGARTRRSSRPAWPAGRSRWSSQAGGAWAAPWSAS
jgi:Fatty acid hydroxylase superfamily